MKPNMGKRWQRWKASCCIMKYKEEHPCVDCGQRNVGLLQFDHLVKMDDNTSIGRLIKRGASLERIWTEVAKCEIRCIQCHLTRHGNRISYKVLNEVIPQAAKRGFNYARTQTHI